MEAVCCHGQHLINTSVQGAGQPKDKDEGPLNEARDDDTPPSQGRPYKRRRVMDRDGQAVGVRVANMAGTTTILHLPQECLDIIAMFMDVRDALACRRAARCFRYPCAKVITHLQAINHELPPQAFAAFPDVTVVIVVVSIYYSNIPSSHVIVKGANAACGRTPVRKQLQQLGRNLPAHVKQVFLLEHPCHCKRSGWDYNSLSMVYAFDDGVLASACYAGLERLYCNLDSTSLLQPQLSALATDTQPFMLPAVHVPAIRVQEKGSALAQPLSSSEAAALYQHCRAVEPRLLGDPCYMERQGDINARMRAILVDWLQQVQWSLKLAPEALWLAISLLDRYLAEEQVTRKELQTVGITALMVASKWLPGPLLRPHKAVYLCDGSSSMWRVRSAEARMLRMLRYSLAAATPYHYLHCFLEAAGCTGEDSKAQLLAQYLLTLALVDYHMLLFGASLQAAAALHVALAALKAEDSYPQQLEAFSGHSRGDVQQCAVALVRLMQAGPRNTVHGVREPLVGAYKKYKRAPCLEVAKVAVPVEILERNGVRVQVARE